MNVYDFDNTIYKGDSTTDFYFFSLRRNPKILRRIPKLLWDFILFTFSFIDKTTFKERMYAFLKDIDDVDGEIKLFWEKNIHKIKDWYKEKKKEDDLIISASPYFLLSHILDSDRLMASCVDKKTGKYEGVNCHGKEKVRRFYEVYEDVEIEEFYSDSYSDTPLAEISKKSYMVVGDMLYPWNEYKPPFFKRLKKLLLDKAFIIYALIGIINTLNNIWMSYVYSLFLNPNIAFAGGYITSLIVAYILNSFITFKQKLSVKKCIKFSVSYIPGFVIQNLAVFIVYNILNLKPIIAYVISAIIGVPITFIILKIFAFNKKSL